MVTIFANRARTGRRSNVPDQSLVRGYGVYTLFFLRCASRNLAFLPFCAPRPRRHVGRERQNARRLRTSCPLRWSSQVFTAGRWNGQHLPAGLDALAAVDVLLELPGRSRSEQSTVVDRGVPRPLLDRGEYLLHAHLLPKPRDLERISSLPQYVLVPSRSSTSQRYALTRCRVRSAVAVRSAGSDRNHRDVCALSAGAPGRPSVRHDAANRSGYDLGTVSRAAGVRNRRFCSSLPRTFSLPECVRFS